MQEPRNRRWAWVLTPLVVGVGAFLFGWIGASVGGRLIWLVVGGLLGGLIGLGLWTGLLLYAGKKRAVGTSPKNDPPPGISKPL